MNTERKKEKPACDSRREFLDMDTDEEDFGYQESPESEEDLPLEPEKPVFNDQQLNTLVQHVKDLIPNAEDLNWHDDSDEVIREYFQYPAHAIMYVWLRETTVLVMLKPPQDLSSGFVYFLRTSYWQIYTPENFHDTVHFGTINSNGASCLLNVFENIYAPAALSMSSNKWPSIMRNSVWTYSHQFLTCLKEQIYKPKGLTLLYVPRICNETMESNTCCLNDEEKDFIETLEIIMRHWIRQIRETLSNVHVRRSNRSIADEVIHWRGMYSELSCLHRQLSKNDVALIVKTLVASKSPMIETFRSLVVQVKHQLQECFSNVHYMNAFHRTCEYFNDDSPDAIVNCARRTLFLILCMWMESSFYSERVRNIEYLCHALSWQVIMQCQECIKIESILAGDAEIGMTVLEKCISFCRDYEKIYRDLTLNITIIICPGKKWPVNEDKVFQHLHAFIARCYDLIYICDAIIVFGSCNKVALLPGTRSTEHEAWCREIENIFHYHLKHVIQQRCYALDVIKSDWLDVMVRFRKAITHLECIVITLINVVFKTVKTVEEGIEALHTLCRFRRRKRINDILQEKYNDVWRIFTMDIENMDADIIEDSDNDVTSILKMRQRYLNALHTMMLSSLYWLGENCPAAEPSLQKYKSVITSINNRINSASNSEKQQSDTN